MTALIAAAMLFAPVVEEPANVRPVWFSRYDQAPTDGTLAYRIAAGQIAPDWYLDYDGLLAVADCGQIGDEFWAELDGEWLRLLVFDCAGHAETVEWMTQGNIVGELDYYTAARLGFTGQGVIAGRVAG